MHFGEKLKELRLNKAEMGLRNFAIEIGIKPSELSDIERGLVEPPSEDVFWKMVEALGITESMEVVEFAEAYRKPFVMQKMPEYGIPAFVCTTDGKPMPADKIEELSNWLNEKAAEHNKKADEYNKRHNNG